MSKKNKQDPDDTLTADKISTADVKAGLDDIEKTDQLDPDDEKQKPVENAGHVFSGQ